MIAYDKRFPLGPSGAAMLRCLVVVALAAAAAARVLVVGPDANDVVTIVGSIYQKLIAVEASVAAAAALGPCPTRHERAAALVVAT